MSSIDNKIRELLESSAALTGMKSAEKESLIPEDYQHLSIDELQEFMSTDEFEALDEDQKLSIAAHVYEDEFADYLDTLDKDALKEFVESELFAKLDEEVKKAVIHKMQNWGSEWGNVDPYTGETLTPSSAQVAPGAKRKDKTPYTGDTLTPSASQTTPNAAPRKKIQKESLSFDMKQDVNALVEGEELSEEFKEKAATIFEAAVISRVKEEITRLEEEFDDRLVEQVETIKEGLVDKVDGYLNYVVEQWISENEIALENGLKNEIMESFIFGMKSLFERHYIEVPEEKHDVFEDLADRLNVTETRMNEQFEANIELRKQLQEMRKVLLIKNVTEGMTSTDAEKLVELAEDISYSSDESFMKKLQTIKESYFDKKSQSTQKTPSYFSQSPVSATPVETLTEDVNMSDPMSHYLRALNRSTL